VVARIDPDHVVADEAVLGPAARLGAHLDGRVRGIAEVLHGVQEISIGAFLWGCTACEVTWVYRRE
jgi:hypothetical protein